MGKSAHVQLTGIIDALESFKDVGVKLAPKIAEVVSDELQKTIAAGTDPYGKAWKLTKDGRVPLRNAFAHVRVAAFGKQVFIRIDDDVHARHHLGAVHGKAKRRIIPSKKKLPDPMRVAIRAVIDKWFEAEVKQHAG